MDISAYVNEFARKRSFGTSLYNANDVRELLKGNKKTALVKQDGYKDSKYLDLEYLEQNIKASVRAITRNKDAAIQIYQDFVAFLRTKGIHCDIEFPPIKSNTFERLMYIAKYLQDPNNKRSDLPDLLWVSPRTIDDDIKKLRGECEEDRIQICGKVFRIAEMETGRNTVKFPSTAHPLFLTPNLTQVLVTLKGLKAMSENPLYAEYAKLAGADIWEQLSDYAKDRIRFVLSELLPEDLTWYESLRKTDDEYFYSEHRCSEGKNIYIDCIKNSKSFYVIYDGENGICIYDQCEFVPGTLENSSFEVVCTQGRFRLHFDKILRSAYTVEELL